MRFNLARLTNHGWRRIRTRSVGFATRLSNARRVLQERNDSAASDPKQRERQLPLRSVTELRCHLIRLISSIGEAMAADLVTKNTVSDLLNYDVSDDDDPFKDIDETLRVRDKGSPSPRAGKRKAEDDKENDILGLDEEVKITKKRKPIAKLDETRLVMPFTPTFRVPRGR